ncbi:HTH domain-containing protein [Chitinophaga niabensis]|uniref:HTH domain-containing protein n=1 Tax=Chitinophaga niabensis TaxID=536979 RepID=A0A1N6JBZ7_9BACT|nr:HTH domain-containing protein [Chitinophaga niabensis]SIO41646.1 HTH domain-containing protein [Chitinophaga niabensis]
MTKDTLQRLERIDRLIQTKATGTPTKLASRIGISERCVYKYLNLMKDFGAPIKFDNGRQSYYYDEEGYFKISFFFKKHVELLIIIPFIL